MSRAKAGSEPAFSLAATGKLIGTLLACTALAGCGGGSRLNVSYSEIPPVRQAVISEQSVRVTLCGPYTQPDVDRMANAAVITAENGIAPTAVSSVLVGLAADFAINLGGEFLDAAQKDRSATYAATGILGSGCVPEIGEYTKGKLIITRGMNGDSDDADVQNAAFRLTGEIIFGTLGNTENDANGALFARVKVTGLEYAVPAPRSGSTSKRVIVLIQIGDKAATGVNPVDDSLTLNSPLRLDLGTLQAGSWYGVTTHTAEPTDTDYTILEHLETSVIMPHPRNPRPVITAVVFETEDESMVLRALTSAYDGKKDDLSSALRDLLKPADSDDADGGGGT